MPQGRRLVIWLVPALALAGIAIALIVRGITAASQRDAGRGGRDGDEPVTQGASKKNPEADACPIESRRVL